MKFADVIVPLAVDGVFTYLVPEGMESQVGTGTLVLVAFAGNKKYTGLVCRVHGQQPEGFEVREIDGIAEEQICFTPLHLRFLLWLGEYYMASPGEVMRAALPVVLRLESFTDLTRTEEEIEWESLTAHQTALLNFLHPGEYISLKDAEKYLKIRNGISVVRPLLAKGYVQIRESVDELFREKKERYVTWGRSFGEKELGEILDSLKRARAQHAMLCAWISRDVPELKRSEFLGVAGNSPAALNALCEKGILAVSERTVSRLVADGDENNCAPNLLSEKQQGALDGIRNELQTKECVLLQGVTSSGKTEVYIHLIREYVAKGHQVLYMLPEIALTIQIVKRLRRVFGDQVGICHSGMSDNMRAEMWHRQCGPDPYRVILGVRSSVFLPFTQLGLIIVDEEHDPSYKQKEPAPRYNGRDAAIMLARMNGAKVLLGSATPSFESYFNAHTGKYGFAYLDGRYGDVLMPQIQIADVGEYRRKKIMQGSFSPLLIREMKKVLDEGMQVILFQNRRGYSSYIQCDQCGAIPKCRHCDVSMTYYKHRNVLSCRYCGSLRRMEDVCESCGTGHYRERTPGTERIEEEVQRFFPASKVARMDLDVMSSKARFRAVIEDFEQGKTDVLIGTQMVTKGLDFERVKLVGVMDADSMVNFPDFRAEERAYCMLMQVSGRSGRRGDRGQVVIQAADPANRIYPMLLEGNYSSFFAQLSEERKFFNYPPFCRLIQIELRHRDQIVLRNAANQLAGELRGQLGGRVFGPAVPEVNRIGGQYRLLFVLKIEFKASFQGIKTMLKEHFSGLQKQKQYGGIKIFCDVDPM